MNYRCFCLLIGVTILGYTGYGQYVERFTTNDDVRLFQTFLEDAASTDVTYGEGFFGFADFNGGNAINLGIQGGIPLSPTFELGARWGFLNLSPDNGDSESGMQDIAAYGKYHIDAGRTQVATGGFITVPIGGEKVGQGNFDLGGFGSLRHPLSAEITVSSTVGLKFEEQGEDRDASLQIGGGIIYLANPNLNFIGELNLETQNNIGLLSGGIDYLSSGNSHFRAVVGLGVDDGSPDLLLQVSFLTFLNR